MKSWEVRFAWVPMKAITGQWVWFKSYIWVKRKNERTAKKALSFLGKLFY